MSEPAGTRMGNEREASGSSASGASESVPEQVKGKVEEGAIVVQEKAQELTTTARERVRQELDTRSSEAGSQLQGTAAAMRRTTEQLRQDGKDGPAKAMEFVAERAERLGGYLTAADSSQLLREVEAFARRQPWLAAAGGAAVGFFASRFLKASSSARYHGNAATASPRPAWQTSELGNPWAETGEFDAAPTRDEAPVLTSGGSSHG